MQKQNKTVILINGLPRAGKDTTADYIVEHYSATKMSFAEPLKSIVANTFDITLDELENYKNNTEDFGVEIIKIKDYPRLDDSETIKFINFRDILRLFGTEGMKPEFGDAVWSDLLYNKVLKNNNNLIVVPDFRFLSEYQPQNGIEIVKFLVKDERKLPTEGHASDVELYQNNTDFDYIINNTGSLDELFNKINSIMKQIRKTNVKS